MRLPYFPIVPRNAPPDDLRSYLELYSREAVGMQASDAPSHAEWDVNLPIPKMRQRWGTERSQVAFGTPVITPLMLSGVGLRELREFSGVGEPMGPAPELRFPSTGIAVVPALWAQRAVNAWNAASGSSTRIATDGIAGSETINALRSARLEWLREQPTPLSTSPRVVAMPTIVDRGHVSLAGDFYGALARFPQVADPSSTPAPTPRCPNGTFQLPDGSCPEAPNTRASGGVVLAVALGIGAAMWFGRKR